MKRSGKIFAGKAGKMKTALRNDRNRSVLIFASATDARMYEIIREAKEAYEKIYLVVQSRRADEYRNRYKFLHIIETKADYIEYKMIKKENEIPTIMYDTVWIPSSFENNMSSFGEVIAMAITVKSKKIIWKGAKGNDIVIDGTAKDKVKDLCHSCFALAFYEYGKIRTRIQNKMKGYRW